MCLFNESKLYVENAQEHNRAFFVCTLRMWASIPALDFLGAMSQLPHLYSTVYPPKLTWIVFSTIGFSSVLTAPTSIGSCSLLLNRGCSWGGCGVGLDVLKKLRQFPHTHLQTRPLECCPPLSHQLVASCYCTNCCRWQKYMYFNIFNVFDMHTIYSIYFI